MKNQFKILAFAAILLLTLAVCIASAIGVDTLLGAANAAPMSLAAIAVLFRPNPTPPPFVPPTPTPTILYPVDIDAYSKIQFGEFDTYNVAIDKLEDYSVESYEYHVLYYTNDGINFTAVYVINSNEDEVKVYLDIHNVEIVSQAIGWYLELVDNNDSTRAYIAVTLN